MRRYVTEFLDRAGPLSLMFDFDHSLSRLSGVTVLCVGDLMLDDFVYGEVARISPEAPAPVIAVKRSEMVIGGAGNVARNIASLGAHCLFVGLVGEDDAGRTLKAALAAEPRIEASAGASTARVRPRARCASCPSITRPICCAPTGRRRGRPMPRPRRRCSTQALPLLPQRRCGGAVGLRQGRADAGADPSRDRCRALGRQAGGRRSQGQRLFDLSRRHAGHAEPQGIVGGRASRCAAAMRRSPRPRASLRDCARIARRCW